MVLNIEDEKYIEKRVNALSIYSVYWCMYELRLVGDLPTGTILKDDSFCKKRLIRILKQRPYSPRDLNRLLEASAENSIPLYYVKWFYEDRRAALWLNMVLKKYNIPSNLVSIESDIDVFVHDVIFNRRVLIHNKNIVEHDSDAQIALKKKTLELLKDIYFLSKINLKDVRWLTSNISSRAKINHIYQYMNKLHDLNNLRRNKESKKKNGGRKTNINKAGCQQALICSDTIKFKETDTAMRLSHILASLDYWMFDTYWFYKEGDVVDIEKADNRMLFISNMEDVWNSKQRRDRNKIKKNQGIDLTNDNKKNLKHLAKACGKTQREVLNDLVESAYSQMRNQEIKLSPSFPNQYKAFDKITLEKPSSLPSEHTEREVISEDTFLTKDKQELSSDYDAESVGSSTYDNEDVPAETITPKQEVNTLQPFYPEGSNGKQAKETADTNTENYAKL